MSPPRRLRVVVTGATGTFGRALVPLLEADDRVGDVVGLARRVLPVEELGWSAATMRSADVREPDSLAPRSRAWTWSCTWPSWSPGRAHVR